MEVFSVNIISKLNLNKKENKFFYLMVFIFFCVGIALGTYIVKYMNANDANDLTSYFSTFAESIAKEPVNSKALLLNVLKKNLILFIISYYTTFMIFENRFNMYITKSVKSRDYYRNIEIKSYSFIKFFSCFSSKTHN